MTNKQDKQTKQATLQDIADEYRGLAGKLLQQGIFLKDTTEGYFAGARIDDIHGIFEELNLGKYKNFLDLGSGDGRVVMMAAAYTEATGIELDKELHELALSMQQKLHTKHTQLKKTTFLQANFLRDINFGNFDVIFINPDQRFYELEKKLRKEMKPEALLIVYNAVFKPLNMTLKQKIGNNVSAGYVYTV
jgi:16S rRNA G1207 methylase RsmC